MKRHCSISHDCFRPSRCDFKEATRFFHDFVANEIQKSFLRFTNHLLVRKGRLGRRIPINHSPTAIDQTFIVKIDKDFLNSRGVSIIERVALT